MFHTVLRQNPVVLWTSAWKPANGLNFLSALVRKSRHLEGMTKMIMYHHTPIGGVYK